MYQSSIGNLARAGGASETGQRDGRVKWGVFFLLAGFSTGLSAADVRGAAIAELGTFSGFPNYPNPNLGTTDFFVRGDEALTTQTARADFQRIVPISNTDPNPRLGLLSQAIVSGRIGTLAGFASAEATGSAAPFPNNGVNAVASVQVFDRLTVSSVSLARGTPVELSFELFVEGNGTFYADYEITQVSRADGNPLNGPAKRLNLQLSGFGAAGIGGQETGTISALVGERYNIFYGLMVAASVSTFGMTGETRFNVSDYSNTGHYYAQADNAAVLLQSESGYDYTAPAPVPLPMSGVLFAPAILALAWRQRTSTT